uniref:Uncharacterized protein n=1 Tax=Cacopsylla melanoneura TaxID=428564 RepID=A0A8D8TF46_9HEMI
MKSVRTFVVIIRNIVMTTVRVIIIMVINYYHFIIIIYRYLENCYGWHSDLFNMILLSLWNLWMLHATPCKIVICTLQLLLYIVTTCYFNVIKLHNNYSTIVHNATSSSHPPPFHLSSSSE